MMREKSKRKQQSHFQCILPTQCIKQSSQSQHLPFKDNRSDSKQVAREAREAIHVGINNPTLNYNIGKCTSWNP